VTLQGNATMLDSMAASSPADPLEQAKILRELAERIEQTGTPIPAGAFAPIADLAEHRARREQLDAVRAAAGCWADEDHPELAEGAADHIARLRQADDRHRGGADR